MTTYALLHFAVGCCLWCATLGERASVGLMDHGKMLLDMEQYEDGEWGFKKKRKEKKKKCDLKEADWKKYSSRVKIDGVGKFFWDACSTQQDGTCPDMCVPYSEGVKLSWSQRSFSAIGRVFSGACKKECRYKDEYMLKEPHHQSFLATSLAVLEDKVSIQNRKCQGIASLVRPGCGARSRKVGSLMSFVMKAANKAGEAAASGNVEDCQDRMPPALGAQLAVVVGSLLDSMQADGDQVDETKEVSKTMPRVKQMAQRFGDPEFCSKSAKLATKLQDPNIMEMMQAGLNESVVHRKGNTNVDVKKVVATVDSMGAPGIVEDQLDQEASELDEKFTELQERSASSALQVSAVGSSNSSVTASLAQLMSEDGTVDNSGHMVLSTEGGKAVTSLQGIGAVLKRIAKGIWWSFVALLYHGIIGTIYGAISTAMCLISLGEYTNDRKDQKTDEVKGEGITNLKGAWKLTWLVSCPLACMSYGWGINPWHWEDSFWQSAWHSGENDEADDEDYEPDDVDDMPKVAEDDDDDNL